MLGISDEVDIGEERSVRDDYQRHGRQNGDFVVGHIENQHEGTEQVLIAELPLQQEINMRADTLIRPYNVPCLNDELKIMN